jgi:hypothetical protein
MPLDDTERERVRYHMGYLSVQPAASIQFGLPAPIQTLFLVELAMTNLLEDGVDRVRQLLQTLDMIEARMRDGVKFLVAESIDNMKIRRDHLDALEDEHTRWAERLSEELGAPLYPGAAKFRKLFNQLNGPNIPVRSGG